MGGNGVVVVVVVSWSDFAQFVEQAQELPLTSKLSPVDLGPTESGSGIARPLANVRPAGYLINWGRGLLNNSWWDAFTPLDGGDVGFQKAVDRRTEVHVHT